MLESRWRVGGEYVGELEETILESRWSEGGEYVGV